MGVENGRGCCRHLAYGWCWRKHTSLGTHLTREGLHLLDEPSRAQSTPRLALERAEHQPSGQRRSVRLQPNHRSQQKDS